jgi:hypothetical protein
MRSVLLETLTERELSSRQESRILAGITILVQLVVTPIRIDIIVF